MFKSFASFRQSHRRGFTLLLAALVASIVLSLGSAIFTIARKEITLSSIGRDSQFAFYAADTAAECALYWDVRYSAFATSSGSAAMQPITCDGVSVTPTLLSSSANSAVSQVVIMSASAPVSDGVFTVDEAGNPQAGNCASFQVAKSPTPPYTVIHANGYSVPCSLTTNGARALQRSIQIQY